MEIIENSLIPIMENKKGEKLVNARELHAFLEAKTRFNDWIKDRIEKYGFIENEDYSSFDEIVEREIGATTRIEYILTLDTAKEISMVENNKKGRQVRRYFINVEKKYNDTMLELQSDAYKRIAILERKLKVFQSKIAIPVTINKREIDVIKVFNLINELSGDGAIYEDIYYKVRKDNYLFIDFRKVYKILKKEYRDIETFDASPLSIERAILKQNFCDTIGIEILVDPKTYSKKAVNGLLIDITKLKEAGANLDNIC